MPSVSQAGPGTRRDSGRVEDQTRAGPDRRTPRPGPAGPRRATGRRRRAPRSPAPDGRTARHGARAASMSRVANAARTASAAGRIASATRAENSGVISTRGRRAEGHPPVRRRRWHRRSRTAPTRCPPERRQVPPDAQPRSEIPGQGTDVGAGGAFDEHIEIDGVPLPPDRSQHIEAADGHRPGGQFDLLTGPHPVVGPLPVHLDRRHRARDLQDLAREGTDDVADRVIGDGTDRGDVGGGDDLSSASSVVVAEPSRMVPR